MRDIKFRAWDESSVQKFVYMTITSMKVIKTDKNALTRVWQQYTGVKDKNGKEIYEGDIITHSNDGMIGVVTWSEGLYRFVIENLKQTEIIADLCDYDFEPEVMGNIYENTELLDGR